MSLLEESPEVNDLSFLALLAAHEIDRLRKQESTDCHYTAVLRERLIKQIPGTGTDGVRGLAPSALRVYRAAVSAATKEHATNYDELAGLIQNLLGGLSLASSDKTAKIGTPELNRLFVFLTTLHGQLLEQKQRKAAERGSGRYRV
jgi:hypothetical protein